MNVFYENKDLSVWTDYGHDLAFGAHLHDHIELVYMFKGRTKVIVDSMECVGEAGDALIIFLNQIHQYQKIDEESYFISIFPQELCHEYQQLFKTKLPASPVIKNADSDGRIQPLIRRITEALSDTSTYHEAIIKGYYLVLLGELFRQMQFREAKASDGNTIREILNHCMANHEKDISLESVACALHISKYHISHLFSQRLHMSFSEYIGMLRISDAMRLLQTQDSSITEIAYRAGFNSTRTLNRLFLKYTGVTPREYKKWQG